MISKVGINDDFYDLRHWGRKCLLSSIKTLVTIHTDTAVWSEMILHLWIKLSSWILAPGTESQLTSTLCPKDSALPSAPPSPLACLNSVGTPTPPTPPTLRCLGHFVSPDNVCTPLLLSTPIWEGAAWTVVSGASCPVSRTERRGPTMGVKSCFSSCLRTALTPCCC